MISPGINGTILNTVDTDNEQSEQLSLLSSSRSGNKIYLEFDGDVYLNGNLPSFYEIFTAYVDGTKVPDVFVNGGGASSWEASKLRVKLTAPVTGNNEITLSYNSTGDADKDIVSSDGRALDSFEHLFIENTSNDYTSPLLRNASGKGRFIELNFNESLYYEPDLPSDSTQLFNVIDQDGNQIAIQSAKTSFFSRTKAGIWLEEHLEEGANYKITYNETEGDQFRQTLQDESGNDASSFEFEISAEANDYVKPTLLGIEASEYSDNAIILNFSEDVTHYGFINLPPRDSFKLTRDGEIIALSSIGSADIIENPESLTLRTETPLLDLNNLVIRYTTPDENLLSDRDGNLLNDFNSININGDLKYVSLQAKIGTSGSDVLEILNGEDAYGLGGHDVLHGSYGYDWIYGGDGNDVILGFDGDDTLYGENDADVIDGGAGRDLIYGGAGNDALKPGESDHDAINGGPGDDLIYEGSGLFIEELGTNVGNLMAYGDTGFDTLVLTGPEIDYTLNKLEGTPLISYFDEPYEYEIINNLTNYHISLQSINALEFRDAYRLLEEAEADTHLSLFYGLHKLAQEQGESNTSALETDQQSAEKQIAVLGDSVDHNARYDLNITAEVLNNFMIEGADITIGFDAQLFNSINASDITIGSNFPIANAVEINNDLGTIRLAAATLSQLALNGDDISGDTVLASISLDFDEVALAGIEKNADGSLATNPLAFTINANLDETVFSNQLDDGSGLENRTIQTLRDLGGTITVDGQEVTLYEAQINLEQQGDGLVLGTQRVIGSDSAYTNLIRSGDTLSTSATWLNIGNIRANNIEVQSLSNANATLASASISQTALNSGSFIDGVFVEDGREELTLTADIHITGQAGNVLDLADGILSVQADGSETFTNEGKGSSNLITFQGDLNYDGRVSMKDLAYLNAGAARQQLVETTDENGNTMQVASEASYARDVDADFSGKIDLADLSVLDADWGKTLHTGDEQFQGSADVSWSELDSQGDSSTWDNDSFKGQNAIEADSAYVGSLEAPGTSGVIGSDGNQDGNNSLEGDSFQDSLAA